MAGRVLSAANEAKLRAALDSLKAVMASMTGMGGGDMAGKGGGDMAGKGGKAAAGAAPMKNAAKPKESARAASNLREARNIGDGIEANIHSEFSEDIDDMFEDGLITRDEWVALYAALTTSLDAFRSAVTSAAPDLYTRDPALMPDGSLAPPEDEEDDDMMDMGDMGMGEAAVVGDFVPLSEAAAVRADGTTTIKLIKAGWGSSGYYSPDMLKRDGPTIFKKGTKQYWNHPTMAEESERPEGDLRNLAGELISDARWQDSGPAGPGLYADAKIFGPYKEAVNELAPHIGVSIRASGRTSQGEAEGRKGPIIEQLVAGRSADFVTVAGAGGKIVHMFEAARNRAVAPIPENKETFVMDEKQFKEAQDKLTEAQKQIDALNVANARFRESLVLRDAKEFVSDKLKETILPDVTKARLLKQLSNKPSLNKEGALDDVAFAALITEAVKAETEYLTQAAGYGSGRIVGMGDSSATQRKPEDMTKALAEGFRAMGLSESESLVAAAGR